MKHNGIFRYLDLLNKERVAVTAPEAIAEVMARTNDFEQSRTVFLLASPALGPGVLFLNGEEHKRHRKILLPSLSTQEIRTLDHIFWEKTVELTAQLTTLVAETALTPPEAAAATAAAGAPAAGFSRPIDVEHYAGHIVLDCISKAAVGMDFQSIRDPDSELVSKYRGLFRPTKVFRFVALAKLYFPARLVEMFPNRRLQEAADGITRLWDLCRASVRDKKAQHADGKLATPDIVSSLIRDRGVSDEDELVTHALQMLAAGHETVGVGITWTMYELCRHTRWQDAVRREIRARLPRPDAAAGAALPAALALEADSMPVLNAVVSESLRYWPPVGQFGRQTARDTMLHGVRIPKDTTVQISIRSCNRDPANWGPDANEFRPERWLRRDPANPDAWLYVPSGGALTKQAMMTFIHGNRDCIGRPFARSAMCHILAGLVGRFEFLLHDQTLFEETKIPISGGLFAYKPLDCIHCHARRVPGW